MRLNDAQWSRSLVAGLPYRWQHRLLRNLDKKLGAAALLPAGRGLVTAAISAANSEFVDLTSGLAKLRLNLNSSDSEICEKAKECAAVAMSLAATVHTLCNVRYIMQHYADGFGIERLSDELTDKGVILRLTCVIYWRRALRRLHARAVEGVAIRLGYVRYGGDLYVSKESIERRQQQIKRNQETLEKTVLKNELGQEFTLAQLAEVGNANKTIRRGELMTRISGFEQIARDSNHVGLFFTVTCPSRMHAYIKTGNGKSVLNKTYDRTTPKEAQRYLSECYAKLRSSLARRGAGLYGFRIAEPHHDGCPHWHLLLFCKADKEAIVCEKFKHYFLMDSGNEPGAKENRVKIVKIDWTRGSAAGYIAKYVAKNIDGGDVGSDLFGNPAIESALRVDAWASTWGIRQFQQIGGAPVGVWRELRRVKSLPLNAPDCIKQAVLSVNRYVDMATGEFIQASWAGYVQAQGGVFIGRKANIKIDRLESSEVGQYSEEKLGRIVGVVGGCVNVASARHVWLKSGFSRSTVNNCTQKIGGLFEKNKNSGSNNKFEDFQGDFMANNYDFRTGAS
jgi:hypothetical protein